MEYVYKSIYDYILINVIPSIMFFKVQYSPREADYVMCVITTCAFKIVTVLFLIIETMLIYVRKRLAYTRGLSHYTTVPDLIRTFARCSLKILLCLMHNNS